MNTSRIFTMLMPAALGMAVAAGAITHFAVSHTSAEGRIVGTLFTEGGVAPGNTPQPEWGAITLTPAHGHVIRVEAGRDGKWSATVPVGTYTVTGLPGTLLHGGNGDDPLVTCTARSLAVVTPGQTTTSSVGCYVG